MQKNYLAEKVNYFAEKIYFSRTYLSAEKQKLIAGLNQTSEQNKFGKGKKKLMVAEKSYSAKKGN